MKYLNIMALKAYYSYRKTIAAKDPGLTAEQIEDRATTYTNSVFGISADSTNPNNLIRSGLAYGAINNTLKRKFPAISESETDIIFAKLSCTTKTYRWYANLDAEAVPLTLENMVSFIQGSKETLTQLVDDEIVYTAIEQEPGTYPMKPGLSSRKFKKFK